MNTSIHYSEEISKRLSEKNLLESVKTVSEPYVVSIGKYYKVDVPGRLSWKNS